MSATSSSSQAKRDEQQFTYFHSETRTLPRGFKCPIRVCSVPIFVPPILIPLMLSILGLDTDTLLETLKYLEIEDVLRLRKVCHTCPNLVWTMLKVTTRLADYSVR